MYPETDLHTLTKAAEDSEYGWQESCIDNAVTEITDLRIEVQALNDEITVMEDTTCDLQDEVDFYANELSEVEDELYELREKED